MERNYILFDTPERDLLYPFTHTRPVAACRVGILTIQEKWEHWLGKRVSHFTMPYLQEKYPLKRVADEVISVLINGHVLPTEALVQAIAALNPGEELYKDDRLLVKVLRGGDFHVPSVQERKNYKEDICAIYKPWEIALLNDRAIREDFNLLTRGRTSAPIPVSNQIIGAENIFLEEGARVEYCTINASTGPVYIGKDALVMEGCLIRGSLAIGERAVLKMGTKVYGATTIGPFCTGGGEIKNTVLFGYSNKAHDGYLGDAVIGEWCNLGANTTCSNLKNNVSEVTVWMEARQEAWGVGYKCGVLMGDYSRCGINTMLNTGTVIGVSCNVFGGDFPSKFLPSFTWGKNMQYRLEDALKDAGAWMRLKDKEMEETDKDILREVFELIANRV
ncbi:putative sugar nucleotidyl transferase [Chitinophaga defluvii]|uniref:Sugar nucleotidyl transferase n=1 Tax=Chitinophaga defluvii TaxID=3163343 RepID=A0ABV2SZL9_9BACT